MRFVANLGKGCCAALALLPGWAWAHSLWINATRYFVEPGRLRTVVYIGWGHAFPADDIPRPGLIKDAWLVRPGGGREKLRLREGGFRATALRLDREGTYIVAAELNPGFYTMALDERGRLHHILGPKTLAKGRVILSHYFEQYAKAVITVGKGSDDFSRPVGQRFEIVPLVNPAGLKVGDYFPVKVLFEGKPASFCRVFATYVGFSTKEAYAYAVTAGLDGVARIRILHPGQWIVKAVLKRPPAPERRGKCDMESYTATLTFAVR